MTAGITILRGEVKAALQDALPDEYTIFEGRLHDSLGWEGPVAATSPIADVTRGSNTFVLLPQVYVQVFGPWDKEVDPNKVIDPAPMEALADAFREALQARQHPALNPLWALQLDRVDYPDDPTGQKTRFVAVVSAMGDNNAVFIRETGP